MMGAAPNAVKILQASNKHRFKSLEISPLMKQTEMCDLSTLPVEFIVFPNVFSILMMETNAAVADNRQPFTYFDLYKEDFTPEWLPPDAIGGVPAHIAEHFKLATDQNKKGPHGTCDKYWKSLQ